MNTGRRAIVAVIGLSVCLLAACVPAERAESTTSAYSLTGKEGVYTLVNLHPDEAATPPRLYSTNYQHDGLIPRCTPVRIDEVKPRAVRFTVLSTGRQYEYIFKYDHITDSQFVHLNKVFGVNCDTAKVEQMSDADRRGIKEGRIYQGMSKDAVILAAGYPPQHRTPSLDADTWFYWSRITKSFGVVFVNGKVDHIAY